MSRMIEKLIYFISQNHQDGDIHTQAKVKIAKALLADENLIIPKPIMIAILNPERTAKDVAKMIEDMTDLTLPKTFQIPHQMGKKRLPKRSGILKNLSPKTIGILTQKNHKGRKSDDETPASKGQR